jgi:sRNA-binding regulator protein Hfq
MSQNTPARKLLLVNGIKLAQQARERDQHTVSQSLREQSLHVHDHAWQSDAITNHA